ncbi:MAG: NusG domain II-containing protein [bacterium]
MLTLGDRLLIGALLVCALLGLIMLPSGRPRGTWAVVESGDGSARRLDLSTDQEVPISGPLGETVVEVSAGRVRVESSPCPHKICVQMGFRDRNGDVIVCIPNKVIVCVRGGERGERVDGVTH